MLSKFYVVQPDKIGDLIFLQKMFMKLSLQYDVKVVVSPEMKYLFDEYMVPMLGVEYVCSVSTDIIDMYRTAEKNNIMVLEHNNDYIYLCNRMWKVDVVNQMRMKYDVLEKNGFIYEGYHDWQNYVRLRRNRKKEDELYKHVVKKEPYTLGNPFFGAGNENSIVRWNDECVSIVYKDGYNHELSKFDVTMSNLPGYSIFDWCRVIENASEIHTMEISLCYLMNVLKLKSSRNVLYTRYSSVDYGKSIVQGLFSFDYVWF